MHTEHALKILHNATADLDGAYVSGLPEAMLKSTRFHARSNSLVGKCTFPINFSDIATTGIANNHDKLANFILRTYRPDFLSLRISDSIKSSWRFYTRGLK